MSFSDGPAIAQNCKSIPFRQIAKLAAAGRYKAKPARCFGFSEVQQAHALMEQGGADGSS